MSTFDPPPELSRLPRLKDTIKTHRLVADKRLGQHFLLDPAILNAIARSAGDIADRAVMEIGPGPGGLTRALLAAGARVTAIERDPRCVEALQELLAASAGRLRLVDADALGLRADAVVGEDSYLIIANLPYNIATALLVHWLTKEHRVADMRLMFQREVADRLIAVPRTPSYGRLSVLAQSLCRVEKTLDLPAGSFHPPPAVRSSLVALTPLAARPQPGSPELRALEQVTAAAFQQRRKMLRSSLKTLGVPVADLLEPLDLPLTARAEELQVSDFVAIAARLVAIRPVPIRRAAIKREES